MLEEYEYDTIEELEEDYGKTSIITQIIRSRVVNFLYENAEVEEVSQDEYYGEDESEDEDTEDGEEAGEGELELETDGEE